MSTQDEQICAVTNDMPRHGISYKEILQEPQLACLAIWYRHAVIQPAFRRLGVWHVKLRGLSVSWDAEARHLIGQLCHSSGHPVRGRDKG